MENGTQRRQTTPRAQAGRRPRSAYRRQGAAPENSMNYKEKFVLQCIVCGMILAGVLLVKIINIPSFNALETSLQTALGDSTTAADLKGAVDGALEKAASLSDSLNTAVGNPPENGENTAVPKKTELPGASALPAEPVNHAPAAEPADDAQTDFRIDEDILQQINSKEDLYNAQKKSTAPN